MTTKRYEQLVMLLIDTSVWIALFRDRTGQAALDRQLLLIHNDQDFETISQVRSLNQLRFQP